MYVSNKIFYVRRSDIEVINGHVIVIDINDKKRWESLMYIPNSTPLMLLKNISLKIKLHLSETMLLLTQSYLVTLTWIVQETMTSITVTSFISTNKLYEIFAPHNLQQIITFDTWSRVINNIHHSSILDHVYVNDNLISKSLNSTFWRLRINLIWD